MSNGSPDFEGEPFGFGQPPFDPRQFLPPELRPPFGGGPGRGPDMPDQDPPISPGPTVPAVSGFFPSALGFLQRQREKELDKILKQAAKRGIGRILGPGIFVIIAAEVVKDVILKRQQRRIDEEVTRQDIEFERIQERIKRQIEAREREPEILPEIEIPIPGRVTPTRRTTPTRRPQRAVPVPEVEPLPPIRRRPVRIPETRPADPIEPGRPARPRIPGPIPAEPGRSPVRRRQLPDADQEEQAEVSAPEVVLPGTARSRAEQARRARERARARSRARTRATGRAATPGGIFLLPLLGVAPATATGPALATPPIVAAPPVVGVPPSPPVSRPVSRGTRRRECKPCEEVKRKRKRRGKCEEGFFRQTASGTQFTTWRTRNCLTGREIKPETAARIKDVQRAARRIQQIRRIL